MHAILVTGASGNVGKAIVEKLVSENQHVIAAVSPRSSGMYEGQKLVESVTVDATDEQQVESLVRAVSEKYTPLIGLVATVGGFTAGSFSNTGIRQLQQMISLNFYTAYTFAKAVAAQMSNQEDGGRMVFIGSRPALDPGEGKLVLAYALSKSLLFELSACINADSAETKVSASVLVPGTIDTDPNRKSMPGADFSKWTKPSDLAAKAWHLISGTDFSVSDAVVKM